MQIILSQKKLENNVNYMQLIDGGNCHTEYRDGVRKVWTHWQIDMILSRACSMYIKNVYMFPDFMNTFIIA